MTIFVEDWADLDDDAFEAVILATRMASDREGGHARCPRRVCRGARRCLGLPDEPGDPPCHAPLSPFALGHAADHWRYTQALLDRARRQGRER